MTDREREDWVAVEMKVFVAQRAIDKSNGIVRCSECDAPMKAERTEKCPCCECAYCAACRDESSFPVGEPACFDCAGWPDGVLMPHERPDDDPWDGVTQ